MSMTFPFAPGFPLFAHFRQLRHSHSLIVWGKCWTISAMARKLRPAGFHDHKYYLTREPASQYQAKRLHYFTHTDIEADRQIVSTDAATRASWSFTFVASGSRQRETPRDRLVSSASVAARTAQLGEALLQGLNL